MRDHLTTRGSGFGCRWGGGSHGLVKRTRGTGRNRTIRHPRGPSPPPGPPRPFSRAYRRLRGCSPTDYQEASRTARKSEPEPGSRAAIPADPPTAGARSAGPATAAQRIDLEESVRALARDLGPDRARELLHRLAAFGHGLQESWTGISFLLSAMELLFEKEYREQSPVEPTDPETKKG